MTLDGFKTTPNSDISVNIFELTLNIHRHTYQAS